MKHKIIIALISVILMLLLVACDTPYYPEKTTWTVEEISDHIDGKNATYRLKGTFPDSITLNTKKIIWIADSVNAFQLYDTVEFRRSN